MLNKKRKMYKLLKYLVLLIFVLILTGQVKSESNHTFYMVGNAHIDLAYRWRWNETVDRVGAGMRRLIG